LGQERIAMSVIFNSLQKKEDQERASYARAEEAKSRALPIAAPPQETLLSVKLSIAFALFISFVAVVACIYLFQAFKAEKKERDVFESGYAQSQEKLQMLEYEAQQTRGDLEKSNAKLGEVSAANTELSKKVEELLLDVSSVHQELAGVANANRDLQKRIEGPANPVDPAAAD